MSDSIDPSPFDHLPTRLLDVLEAGARGSSDKEIAAVLGMSVHTVDAHWRRLRENVGAANRTETVGKFVAWRYGRTLSDLQREVAERKAAEERLQAANDQLRAVMEERDALAVRAFEAAARASWKDAHDRERLERLERAVQSGGTMYYEAEFGGLWRKHWATANFAQLGYSVEEFVQGTIRVAELMPPSDTLASLARFERAVAQGESSFVSYYRFRRADGSLRWIRDHVTLIRNEAGEVVRYTGAATDVTELVGDRPPETVVQLEGRSEPRLL